MQDVTAKFNTIEVIYDPFKQFQKLKLCMQIHILFPNNNNEFVNSGIYYVIKLFTL